MSTYYGINSDYASTLFSSLNTTANSTNDLTGLLSEYSSIKSGSYKKLLTAYYAKNSDSETGAASSISTASDSSKKLTSIQSTATDLMESAKKLYASGSTSVFKKVSSTDEDGKTTENYDVDGIYNAVKNFVADYNDLIDSTETSNTASIANNVNSMITTTRINSQLLSKIGITVNSDFQMELDEDIFKNADMATVKSLFNGNGSYGYQMGVKASMINANVNSEIAKSNTYTSYGTYSSTYSSGDLYSSLF